MAGSCAPLSVIAGGYQSEFVESIPDILSCSICFLPFRDPHLVSCCGAKFCEACIERVKSAGQPCPLCRKQEFISLLDRSLQRKVLEMKVCCSRKKDGCQWVGELRHLVPHENEECVWAVVECSYQCGAHLPRRLMDEHLLDECPQRPIDAKLESVTRRMETQVEREIKKMETKLMTEREQHEREMKKLENKLTAVETDLTAMETGLTAEREQHEREMKAMETKLTAMETGLTAEREQHEREMKAMETKLTAMETELTAEREQHEREMKAMETKLTALRDQHKLEMERLEFKLAAEKEQHERQMETRLTTKSEQYEKELVAVKETIEIFKDVFKYDLAEMQVSL